MTDPTDNFASRLLTWFDQYGRHDLPWQAPRSAYRVWVSEIMLQQTQVTTVIPYFQRFVGAFPNVSALAAAPIDNVLHLWSGLGYYARARNLHKAAGEIVARHGGECPANLDDWLALPGVGPSTAAAIVAQAFGQRHAILDGNVKRVLARYHGVRGWPGERAVETQLWAHARTHTPDARVCDYTQAIMDMGATLCKRTRPVCQQCPVHATCFAFAHDAQAELPERKPKKAKPVRATTMLIARRPGGAVLLAQRPPSGIWGGLWSLPELDDGDSPGAWCGRHFGVTGIAQTEQPVLRHTFSHFHLDITPVLLELPATIDAMVCDGGWVWYDRAAPAALGLAAPVAKLLGAQPVL